MKMKSLVMFYSLDGNCRFIGESIANHIGADILEIKTVKDLSKKGKVGKLFWGGRQVMMKEKPEIIPLEKNPEDYDIIVLGTPVWVGTFAPPLGTLFDQIKLTDKKIACYYCHGGGPGKIKEKLTKILQGNEIIGWISFDEPLKKSKGKSREDAISWIKSLNLENIS